MGWYRNSYLVECKEKKITGVLLCVQTLKSLYQRVTNAVDFCAAGVINMRCRDGQLIIESCVHSTCYVLLATKRYGNLHTKVRSRLSFAQWPCGEASGCYIVHLYWQGGGKVATTLLHRVHLPYQL